MSFLRRIVAPETYLSGAGIRFFKIAHKGDYFYDGPFDTDIEAAQARDKKATELLSEYAWLNFPEEAGEQKAEDGGQKTED